jgi:hypothetical protein
VALELAGQQPSIKFHLEKKFQGSSLQFQEKTEDCETEEARSEASSSFSSTSMFNAHPPNNL